MREITATELARNLRQILDQVAYQGEEIVVVRNKQKVARLLPGSGMMNALQAFADLYQSLPESAAKGWVEEARHGLAETLSDKSNPWDF
jgi:antitoxin (DNA-binding transcriptional repressor) of toxin-antitoxin stability system